MSLDSIFKEIVGPYGALFLLLVAVIGLWRDRQQLQSMVSRQEDLFEEALKLIREDLLPLIRDRRR